MLLILLSMLFSSDSITLTSKTEHGAQCEINILLKSELDIRNRCILLRISKTLSQMKHVLLQND